VIIVGVSGRIPDFAHCELRAQMSSELDREAVHVTNHEDYYPLKDDNRAVRDRSPASASTAQPSRRELGKWDENDFGSHHCDMSSPNEKSVKVVSMSILWRGHD
jgi:hypothetical protein